MRRRRPGDQPPTDGGTGNCHSVTQICHADGGVYPPGKVRHAPVAKCRKHHYFTVAIALLRSTAENSSMIPKYHCDIAGFLSLSAVYHSDRMERKALHAVRSLIEKNVPRRFFARLLPNISFQRPEPSPAPRPGGLPAPRPRRRRRRR